MVDYRVTFKGDLGNLAQFDAAIKNTVQQSARAIEQANKSLLSQVGTLSGIFNPSTSGAGLWADKLRTQVDGVNRTFIQSGQVVRRVVSDYQLAFDQINKTFSAKPVFDTLYESPYKKIIGDLDAYEAALTRMAPIEQRILADREATLQRTIPLQNRIRQLQDVDLVKAQERIKSQRVLNDVEENIVKNKIATAQAGRALIPPTDLVALRAADRGIRDLQRELRDAERASRAALRPLLSDLRDVNRDIGTLTGQVNRLEGAQRGRASIIRSRSADYDQNLPPGTYGPPLPGLLSQAANAVPPIQKDLATVLARSEDLRKNLLKQGLGLGAGYNTDAFRAALAQQEASISNYTKNLRTNVTTIQGSFRDADGLINKFAVDLDSNGKVIGRWGGQLAGAGQFLRQTVRDFQKVIEWTVATTLVFGTLATVVGQLKTINELNASLAHLAITAQTTAEETQNLFSSLGRVAIETATPLNELVKVADDIALATKEAGDSTAEWQGKIVDLTRAVGIFTNLAGVDTVQASDQLSAAFKQLGIAPSELIGVLSKVTAVAGGQSTAIADIVKGLSSVSEAASAAGLSLDEQITSIQVLSQVTNKSSDEIATAFKNLFGSVSSVGSEKILAQFGIEIRDAEGGMRDFLDIYRDVQEAVETGVIPQNRLSDVLRGIAGGPRRAPDAAALLSNIGRIDATVGTSINATNEALIANAKILDTNAAKIRQFQNSVDIVIFEKFGKVVQDLIGTLTEFGNVFLNIFNLFDANVLSLLVNLGAVTLSAKLLVATFRQFSGIGLIETLSGIAKGFRGVQTAANGAATATAAATAAGTGPGTVIPLGPGGAASGGIRGLLTRLGGNRAALLGAGTAGAIGAVGATGIGGGINPGTVGTIAQVAGSLALLGGVSAPLGVALLGVGTALQFVDTGSKEVTKSQHDLQGELLTNIDALKASQSAAEGFANDQEKAAKIIDNLRGKANLTSGEQGALAAATDSYAVATLSLAEANERVSESFDDILKILPGLGEGYKNFANITREVGASSPQITQLRDQLVKELLESTGQGLYARTSSSASPIFREASRDTNTIATNITRGPAGGSPPIDLSDLISRPGLLTQLFNLDNGAGSTFNIPQNDLAFSYLTKALADVGTDLQKYGVSEEQFANLTQAISELTIGTSTLAENVGIVANVNAQTQANSILGIFDANQTANATLAGGLLGEIVKAQRNAIPAAGPAAGPTSGFDNGPSAAVQKLQEAFKRLQDAAAEGLELPNTLLVEIAENALKAGEASNGIGSKYDELRSKGEDALARGIILWLENAGVGQEVLNELTEQYKLNLEEVVGTVDEVKKAFEDARRSATQTYDERRFDLIVRENSGEFKDNAEGLKVLKQQNREAYEGTLALQDAISGLSGGALVELNNQLANVIGLQGEYITDAELATFEAGELEARVLALSNKFYENAVAAGVNADGLRDMQTEVGKLIGLVNAIPTYRKILIDIQTTYTNLQNAGPRGYLSAAAAQALQDSQKAAEKGLKDANISDPTSQINKILREINNIIKGGTGSKLGSKSSGSKSTAPGPDVSTLDLPEEIANAANRSALIQEAVKRARALQGQIPGENKEAKNDIVELLKGTQRILEVRGVKDDYLRKALEELAAIEKKRLEFETKADTIRRIRVGSGDFGAIANVPVNSRTGVSLGSPDGPINVTLNLNGTIATPAQMAQLADLIAASLKRQLSNA